MFIRMGLYGRVRWKKPWLSKKHIAARQKWAGAHSFETMMFWRRMVFSDESKFNLFGSDGKLYCRRRVGEALLERNVKKVVKHGGGNIQVWGCITWDGPGRLHRVEGRMNAVQFCDILSESLLGSLADYELEPRDVVFQQDNDPKHTSKLAKKWFKDHKLELLPWPASSPDMNIIENVWDTVDARVRARKPLPRNLEELWEALQEEWAKLDLAYIRHLYESMPRRVNALWTARGKYTKY
ncbi:hypothetical protein HGRIS_014897 [Hohenbuehelia grisea]|uniref:Tc1-like transposase DDE domain-containing protein n=1 Tax=Hohenbuehelia grisea TaxID=104357 RepID=A0ABR3JNI5_9AGAR